MPDHYYKKTKEASLYSFGINTGKLKHKIIYNTYIIIGQRCMTCHAINVSDILSIVPLKNGNIAVKV